MSASQSLEGSLIGGSSLGRGSFGRNVSRGSGSNVSFAKPSSSTLTSLAGNSHSFLSRVKGESFNPILIQDFSLMQMEILERRIVEVVVSKC